MPILQAEYTMQLPVEVPDVHVEVINWLARLPNNPDGPGVQLVLPPALTKSQRASLHKIADRAGLHTCSEVWCMIACFC